MSQTFGCLEYRPGVHEPNVSGQVCNFIFIFHGMEKIVGKRESKDRPIGGDLLC